MKETLANTTFSVVFVVWRRSAACVSAMNLRSQAFSACAVSLRDTDTFDQLTQALLPKYGSMSASDTRLTREPAPGPRHFASPERYSCYQLRHGDSEPAGRCARRAATKSLQHFSVQG